MSVGEVVAVAGDAVLDGAAGLPVGGRSELRLGAGAEALGSRGVGVGGSGLTERAVAVGAALVVTVDVDVAGVAGA